MNTITIELPLPHQVLHPNGRTRNHGYRASLIRKARADAGIVGKLMKPDTCPWKAATVHPTFFLSQRRDEDGLYGWLKPYLDGIADAGVVVNDSVFRQGAIEQVTGRNVDRKVVLIIERED